LTSKTDEETIREFLRLMCLRPMHDAHIQNDRVYQAKAAYEALDRILSRTLPELPEGWELLSARYHSDGLRKGWKVMIIDRPRIFQKDSIIEEFRHKTFPKALAAASAKIRKQP
jgi:hypothetical protein